MEVFKIFVQKDEKNISIHEISENCAKRDVYLCNNNYREITIRSEDCNIKERETHISHSSALSAPLASISLIRSCKIYEKMQKVG